MSVRIDHASDELKNFVLREVFAGLHALVDEMVEAGNTLLHLDEPLPRAVEFGEFLGDDVAALELDEGGMRMLAKEVEQLDLLFEYGFGIAIDESNFLDALYVLLVAAVDGFVDGVVALGDETRDTVVREELAIAIYKPNLLHLKYITCG